MLARLGARALTLDPFDREAVRRAVAGHDTVINLATHIPRSTARMLLPGAWRENDRLRRDGATLLADAARAAGAARFIQESFAPVYADQGDRWIAEESPLRPARYNRTVVDAEAAAIRFGEGGGAGVVLRFAAFYGPDSSHFEEMLASVRRGLVPLPGAAGAYFSFVSLDDAATAALTALDVPAGAYNVAHDEPVTRQALGDTLADVLGVPRPRPMPKWMVRLTGSLGELGSRSLRISNSKLRSASSWRPAYGSLRDGFQAAILSLGNRAPVADTGRLAAG